MKCDWCKKPLDEEKAVYATAGIFHGECLDKLHVTGEAFGKLFFAMTRLQRPGGQELFGQALKEGAGPMSDYFKKLAQNIRDRQAEEKKGKPDDE